MIENAAEHFCLPQVVFQSKEWNINGKKVLEINIPKSEIVPHKAPDKNGKYKAFIRMADENILACGVQVKVWQKRANLQNIRFNNSITERMLLELLQKDDPVTIPYLNKVLKLSKYKLENLLSDFILLDLASMQTTADACYFVANEFPGL